MFSVLRGCNILSIPEVRASRARRTEVCDRGWAQAAAQQSAPPHTLRDRKIVDKTVWPKQNDTMKLMYVYMFNIHVFRVCLGQL